MKFLKISQIFLLNIYESSDETLRIQEKPTFIPDCRQSLFSNFLNRKLMTFCCPCAPSGAAADFGKHCRQGRASQKRKSAKRSLAVSPNPFF